MRTVLDSRLWQPLRRAIWRRWIRILLRRVCELKDSARNPSHPDAYFQDFEDSLYLESGKLAEFRRLEAQLIPLDGAAWGVLRERALPHLVSRQRQLGRGWQQLFDTLNEARAYNYLRGLSCSGVEFIPPSESKGERRPDLTAILDGTRVLAEVKTLNISEIAADQRVEVNTVGYAVGSTTASMDPAFFTGKLQPTLVSALGQLGAMAAGGNERHIIFLCIHFDD